ncbi:MAG TPA: hypothetical protein VHR66_02260 [Gemmataceae bacterium]|jgi:hypothetical protein|nr:hypothetical protein [Gemmataceae bacterium]
MSKWLVIDEFRVAVLVPIRRTPPGAKGTLDNPKFLKTMRAAIRRLVEKTPGLTKVRVRVSR